MEAWGWGACAGPQKLQVGFRMESHVHFPFLSAPQWHSRPSPGSHERLPPLIQCPPQGFLSSPRNSNGTGLSGGHLPPQQQQRLCTLCFQGP